MDADENSENKEISSERQSLKGIKGWGPSWKPIHRESTRLRWSAAQACIQNALPGLTFHQLGQCRSRYTPILGQRRQELADAIRQLGRPWPRGARSAPSPTLGLFIFLRISGKRTLTKPNAFALGSMLATVLLSKDVAPAEDLIALALLISFQFVITWGSLLFLV